MRIVSLLPSATEIVYALGLEDQLEGVTDECDWPPEARDKSVVVRSLQPAGLGAGAIDAWVHEQGADGLYELDDEAIGRIAPDLILTQDLCRVCAVPTGDVDAALERIGCAARVLTIEPQRLDEVLGSVGSVAVAAGVADRGRRLIALLRDRLAAVSSSLAGREPVRTLVLEWLDPPYTAGHWVPDVVRAAGGVPLLGEAGRPSRPSTWGDMLEARPEVVVLAPCGVTAERAWAQAAESVPAELNGERTVVMDLARPGPRLVDCVEALAAVLHPGSGLPPRPDVVHSRGG